MDPTTVPIWQPLESLLAPAMLLLVPLCIAITEGILRIPKVSALRPWGFLVSMAVGVGLGEARSLGATGALDWGGACLLQGLVIGILAAIGYQGWKQTVKTLEGTDKGAVLVLLCAGCLVLAGCGDATFTRYAIGQATASFAQAKVGLTECRRDIDAALAREADTQWRAYVADQADTAADAVAQARKPEEIKKAMAGLAAKFRIERIAVLELNRQRVDERFKRVDKHLDFIATIFIRLDTQARREEDVQAQLEQYQTIAEQAVREKFGLTPDVLAAPSFSPAPSPPAATPVAAEPATAPAPAPPK